jgi:hypothetical protein
MKIKILWAAAMVLCLSLAGCWSLIYSQGAKNVFLNSVLEVGRIGIVDADTAYL